MSFIAIFLKGFSQIVFIDSQILGLFIIIGTAIAAPYYLLLASIGNIVGILTGMIFQADKNIIEIGKFGFNAALIGFVISLQIKQAPQAIVFTVIFSFAASLIYYLFLKNNIEIFTAPFVLSALIIIYFAKNLI